ncbi:MAG: exonuclease, partial [Chitinophagaceae bacterium]
MILDNFLVLDEIGLHCSYGGFYLDPKMPVSNAVISHAHADHAVSGNTNVFCTEATSRFMTHRYKRFAAQEFNIHPYHEEFTVGAVKIIFIPAGHMLGSAQVLMTYQGVRYLYTGDFKLEEDQTCHPLEYVKA